MRYIDFNSQKFSKLALGTVQLGLEYGVANSSGKPDKNSAKEILEYLVNAGINTFDTALAYGESQKILGEVLKKEDIHIISKLSSNDFIYKTKESINSILDDLKRDSITGIMLHDSDLILNWSNKYTDIIKSLKEQNIINYFGISIYEEIEFEKAKDIKEIDIIQIPFNILDNRAIKNNWLKDARERNILLFIRSVYLQGLLFLYPNKIPNNLKESKSYMDKLNHIAQTHQLSIPQLALSFVESVAHKEVILFGCENLQQAKSNIKEYESIKLLDNNTIEAILEIIDSVPQNIINPSKWNI